MNISYKKATQWIAYNDEPNDLMAENIKRYISTALVADLFGKTTEAVAIDVANLRTGVIKTPTKRQADALGDLRAVSGKQYSYIKAWGLSSVKVAIRTIKSKRIITIEEQELIEEITRKIQRQW